VKQEQQAIDAQFEKKRKGAETAQKMCVSPFFHSQHLKN
jgi:V-type H+-transporting ATPase subunit E